MLDYKGLEKCFEKLPTDLQHLLKKSEGKTEVDLSNYSLQWLSNDAFQILSEGLHQNKRLRKLLLRNCDLSFCFNQKSEQIKNLLRGLNNLETIDLSNSQLCLDDISSSVLTELAHLPRLNKLILLDEHHSAWVPELFEGLRNLPIFRVYEQEGGLCFLNYHEANALMEALRTEEKTAQYFLGEPKQVESKKNEPGDSQDLLKSLQAALEAHSNIKTWFTYYKAMSFSPPKHSWLFPPERVSFTQQMVAALRFIDRLRVPGLSLRYFSAIKIFMLDIDQGYAASFEQLMVALLDAYPFFQKIDEAYFSSLTTKKKPAVATWQIMFPPFAISQVGWDLLQDVRAKYGNRITVMMREPKPSKNLEEEKNKYTTRPTIDLRITKALTLRFAQENLFHQLTQNRLKATLNEWLSGLNQLFNDPTTKPLVYEFFIVHHLCTIAEIRNLEELHAVLAQLKDRDKSAEAKTKLAPLDQEILGLLKPDSTTLGKWLAVTLPTENTLKRASEQSTLPTLPQTSSWASQRTSEPEIKEKTRSAFAEEQILLQARAWLGAIAFHHLTGKTAAAGMYWYGRYLETLPLTEKKPPLESSQNFVLEQARKSGLYWLRLAALRYEHRASTHYLQERANSLRERAEKQKTTIQALLRPADCYQLMLTCEALAPILQHRQLAPPNHLLSLFAEVGNLRDMALELDILYGNRYSDNMFALLLVIASVSKDLITWFMQAGMSREFFKDRTYKNNYLRTMQFYLISLVADNLISESVRGYYLQELAAHHPKSVLAAQLISPPLKEESNAVVRYHAVPLARVITDKLLPLFQMHSNLKVKKNLDEEEAKLKDFCEFFDKHIPQYLAHGRLFNVLINEREDPYFIAAMLHNILNEALVYFGLDNSSFAEKIHETMQDIKSTLDYLGGKHLTALQPTSMGFTATLSQQLESYAATANVANVVKLKLLPKFAASPSEYHLPHQKETSLATKALYGGAALVEVAHFSLPLIVLATGVGLPALLGGGALVQGVRMALENVHPYAEAAEHFFEQNIFINMIPQLAHIHHSVHEAGIFSHEHQEERHQLIEASVLSELNHLVSNASPIHRDAFSMLVRHWDMVYCVIPLTLKTPIMLLLLSQTIKYFSLSFLLFSK
ncbi:hypothetical protein [Legionella maceachernii]|uniref:hypothetical protein n=1 Tax=Legionella maceachernii TaxID=466 RepID=UPI000999A30A|nr:hypothetical protein [Legionella maceachernii]SKA31151.1 hypothetical protein SAMN02745128_03254 [Legionella maceachernii]